MSIFLAMIGIVGFLVSVVLFIIALLKKDKERQKKVLILFALSVILFFVGAMTSPDGEDESKPKSNKTTQTTKRKETKESSSKTKESISSTVKASTSSSSSSSSSKKEFTEADNANYASFFESEINNTLSEQGIETTVTVNADGAVLLYVNVPQDYKYQSKATIQQLADAVLSAKNSTFAKWQLENGFSDATAPLLYLQTQDGTNIAKESLWSGNMKVLVDN